MGATHPDSLPSKSMNERDGCKVLLRVFQEAGLRIEQNVRFAEGAVEINLDGFDAEKRIGFEYITTEAGDRSEMTPEVVEHLDRRMRSGELHVLLVDENDVVLEEDLVFAAKGFLEHLRKQGRIA